MKRQKRGIPKARCEIRIPTELDGKLDKIALKAGVTRTSLVITAMERLVYGEETAIGVDAVHERVAVLTVNQEKMRSELLEIRAYLDAIAQTMCGGQEAFDSFLEAVDKVKFELMTENAE